MSKKPLSKQIRNIPPAQIFNSLLDAFTALSSQFRLQKLKPLLITFTLHPTIKELLDDSNAPAPPPPAPSDNLELKKI